MRVQPCMPCRPRGTGSPHDSHETPPKTELPKDETRRAWLRGTHAQRRTLKARHKASTCLYRRHGLREPHPPNHVAQGLLLTNARHSGQD